MLNEFVEKILVHERARKGSQDTTQEVEIYFNFVGRYIPPALQPVPLTPEEQEETAEEGGTQGQASPELLAPQGKRQAEGMGRNATTPSARRKWRQQRPRSGPRDMEKGIFTTVSQLPKQEPRKATVSTSAAV